MTNIPFNIDYYILGGEGEILDARSAQIFAVDSETSFEDVEDLMNEHYDSVETLDVMSTLKFLPAPSAKPVDVVDLLTTIANGWSSSLTMDERKALLELRDNL
jgi:U3 small nucleolar ribonucleoprotein component